MLMMMPSWTWVAALGDFGKTRELLVGMQDRFHTPLTYIVRKLDGLQPFERVHIMLVGTRRYLHYKLVEEPGGNGIFTRSFLTSLK